MIDHRLKVSSEDFSAVKSGIKTAELRLNDCDFQVGDELVLVVREGLTADEIRVVVTHMQVGGSDIPYGYCMLSFFVKGQYTPSSWESLEHKPERKPATRGEMIAMAIVMLGLLLSLAAMWTLSR